MDLVQMLRWVALINYLAIFFPKGGNSSFVNMFFDKVVSTGERIVLHKTYTGARSDVDCARLCKEDRETQFECMGFRFLPQGTTCELYRDEYNEGEQISMEIFQFQVENVFHDIRINGVLYSVYFNTETRTYSDARDHCNSVGGYLLEFDTADEYKAVQMVIGLGAGTIYVGANDIENEGTWVTDHHGLPISEGEWYWMFGPNVLPSKDCALLFFPEVQPSPCYYQVRVLCERDIL